MDSAVLGNPGGRDVRERHDRHVVVVRNRHLVRGRPRGAVRAAQLDVEGFVALVQVVFRNADRERVPRNALGEGQGSRRRRIVLTSFGRAVGGLVFDRDRPTARLAQGRDEGDRAVALGDAGHVQRHGGRSVIVFDRHHMRGRGGQTVRAVQRNSECLFSLVHGVVRDVDRQGRIPRGRRELQRTRFRRVVLSGDGAVAVGAYAVFHRHFLDASPTQARSEGSRSS